ncbi:MAG TPA: hypothetical protein V6D46_10155 [Coleofasciculaceae cyanobacterium]
MQTTFSLVLQAFGPIALFALIDRVIHLATIGAIAKGPGQGIFLKKTPLNSLQWCEPEWF